MAVGSLSSCPMSDVHVSVENKPNESGDDRGSADPFFTPTNVPVGDIISVLQPCYSFSDVINVPDSIR